MAEKQNAKTDLEGSPTFHRHTEGRHYVARVTTRKVVILVSELSFRERIDLLRGQEEDGID